MSGWIEVLRAACAATTQAAVAKRIGYSTGTISAVLSGTYGKQSKRPVDLTRIQTAVEGALMGNTVDCPVVGQIPRQKCVEHQRAPFRITNPTAVALHRACRGGCPHSLIKSGTTAGEE